ncbi:cupin domain-containing protein [Halopenitus persicus]|uniref:Cupin domain-containing protein n=1 Tax=Halopenitus persicus TaxID=1048396 RepID=A0A1H3KWJ2_9EURY|nr:cupin domain-containing protein [Halopenitus persicus]QHS18024.1 cupin domain-containing protein [haloarchaeon 3A1-DGR]SDY56543.1 Cupin domain-containing protein [Halopenitus persicus]
MEPVNEADLEWSNLDREDATFRRKQLGEAAGGEKLGCSLYELPAGERSWPYHYHTANEEAIYVLAGAGTLRLGEETYSITAGDYVALPADASGGHRVINDGDDTLRYLVASTMREPDVTVYPDRDRIGVFVGSPPGGRDGRSLHGYYPIDDDVDYWEDEADAKDEADANSE